MKALGCEPAIFLKPPAPRIARSWVLGLIGADDAGALLVGCAAELLEASEAGSFAAAGPPPAVFANCPLFARGCFASSNGASSNAKRTSVTMLSLADIQRGGDFGSVGFIDFF